MGLESQAAQLLGTFQDTLNIFNKNVYDVNIFDSMISDIKLTNENKIQN